ncbi:tetratricopeptide repeat protein, partial [Pyxidicoccus sp. 3LG]
MDAEALARLAEAQADPWMLLMAEQERAAAEQRAGLWWKAEQRLQEALESCLSQSIVYRCLGIERELTHLYLGLHRPADALRYAWRGWSRAKAARDWSFEQHFLQTLAVVARYQNSFASARAYLGESLARMPEDCEQRTHVFRDLAATEWQSFRPDGARRALDRALACDRPLGLSGAFVLSNLARSRPQPRDGDYLRRALVDLRRQGVRPGGEAMLVFIEGQFELARSRADGHALLSRAIQLAERVPTRWRRARPGRTRTGPRAEAGEGGRLDRRPGAAGAPAPDGPAPRQCMLAVALVHERT